MALSQWKVCLALLRSLLLHQVSVQGSIGFIPVSPFRINSAHQSISVLALSTHSFPFVTRLELKEGSVADFIPRDVIHALIGEVLVCQRSSQLTVVSGVPI